MRKILLRLSLLIVLLAILSVYSFAVYKIGQGDKRMGALTKPIETFATFPMMVHDVLNSAQITGIPPTYVRQDTTFQEFNHLDYDLYGLNAFWNNGKDQWDIRLFNFKNDEVLHEWHLTRKGIDLSTTQNQFENSEVRNCLVTNDLSLIAYNVQTPNLTRLDANSNIVWQNHDLVYHHAMNFDADSNIWVCASDIPLNVEQGPLGRYVKNIDGRTMSYREDYIAKLDPESGKVLYKKGISQILLDHGYKNFVFGYNVPEGFPHDPIHLNDIEPVLEDGTYWKKGDLLLSIRNKCLVLLYRPSTDEIVRMIFGPFLNQHDVDIISDNEISVFNNNLVTSNGVVVHGKRKPDWPYDSAVSSEVVILQFTGFDL